MDFRKFDRPPAFVIHRVTTHEQRLSRSSLSIAWQASLGAHGGELLSSALGHGAGRLLNQLVERPAEIGGLRQLQARMKPGAGMKHGPILPAAHPVQPEDLGGLRYLQGLGHVRGGWDTPRFSKETLAPRYSAAPFPAKSCATRRCSTPRAQAGPCVPIPRLRSSKR